jgi:NAD(P) transhydrogenase subunit alpha
MLAQKWTALVVFLSLFWGSGVSLWAQTPPSAFEDPAGATAPSQRAGSEANAHGQEIDYVSLLFVFVLATFIGLGVVTRVSRLLHTPLMSLTNAISAIAVVGAIVIAGTDSGSYPQYPLSIRVLGAIAVFASMTNVVSGFLITDRMLKMFKQTRTEAKQ